MYHSPVLWRHTPFDEYPLFYAVRPFKGHLDAEPKRLIYPQSTQLTLFHGVCGLEFIAHFRRLCALCCWWLFVFGGLCDCCTFCPICCRLTPHWLMIYYPIYLSCYACALMLDYFCTCFCPMLLHCKSLLKMDGDCAIWSGCGTVHGPGPSIGALLFRR